MARRFLNLPTGVDLGSAGVRQIIKQERLVEPRRTQHLVTRMMTTVRFVARAATYCVAMDVLRSIIIDVWILR